MNDDEEDIQTQPCGCLSQPSLTIFEGLAAARTQKDAFSVLQKAVVEAMSAEKLSVDAKLVRSTTVSSLAQLRDKLTGTVEVHHPGVVQIVSGAVRALTSAKDKWEKLLAIEKVSSRLRTCMLLSMIGFDSIN